MTDMMWTIDTDARVTEAPDTWSRRMSARKWGDRLPTVKWNSEQRADWWYIGGRPVVPAWASAKADWPDKKIGAVPPTQEDAPVASYDAGARVKMMDDTGILAQALYPNIALLGRHRLDEDPELALEMAKVYNDFLIDWIAPEPSRFIPIAPLPYWDLEESVREVERVAELGHKGLMMHPRPQVEKLPVIGDPHWNPLWEVAQAHNLPISFHAGSPDDLAEFVQYAPTYGKEAAAAYSGARAFLSHGMKVLDLLMSGVLARYPKLKFFTVEAGVGWVPYALDSIEYSYGWTKTAASRPEFGELTPTDYYRRQLYVSFWYEKMDPWLVEKVGAETIMFETDYPHDTALSGDQVQAALRWSLSDLDEPTRERLLWRNAAELYGLDVEVLRGYAGQGRGEWM